MTKIESYRATARRAIEAGDRIRFIAMRRAECHVLIEQAKAMPKRISLPEHEVRDSPFGPIRPTVINQARQDLIARICARSNRLARMDRRARGVLCQILARPDGFWDVMQDVPGLPLVPAGPRHTTRAGAEEWAQRNGYTISKVVLA